MYFSEICKKNQSKYFFMLFIYDFNTNNKIVFFYILYKIINTIFMKTVFNSISYTHQIS